jgi:uncharacterized membrane protein
VVALIGASWTDRAYGLGTAIFWFALIFALLAVAVTLVRKFRERGSRVGSLHDRTAQDTDDPSELLSKFRELHSRGTLSDGEYRTIKSKLAAQIQAGVGGSHSQPAKTPKPKPEADG